MSMNGTVYCLLLNVVLFCFIRAKLRLLIAKTHKVRVFNVIHSYIQAVKIISYTGGQDYLGIFQGERSPYRYTLHVAYMKNVILITIYLPYLLYIIALAYEYGFIKPSILAHNYTECIAVHNKQAINTYT